jgi:hypothetical protein
MPLSLAAAAAGPADSADEADDAMDCDDPAPAFDHPIGPQLPPAASEDGPAQTATSPEAALVDLLEPSRHSKQKLRLSHIVARCPDQAVLADPTFRARVAAAVIARFPDSYDQQHQCFRS